MEPKNRSTIRSILKKAQGEKIAPYVFKINDTQTLQQYPRYSSVDCTSRYHQCSFVSRQTTSWFGPNPGAGPGCRTGGHPLKGIFCCFLHMGLDICKAIFKYKR